MCEKCRAVRIDEYVDNPFIAMNCEDKVVGLKPPLIEEVPLTKFGVAVVKEWEFDDSVSYKVVDVIEGEFTVVEKSNDGTV